MTISRLKLIFISIYLFIGYITQAQYLDTILNLNTISVSTSKYEFLVGSKVESLDSIYLQAGLDGSLTGIITNYFPIYVKENAGGLATIRFRGTSADHTSIMFSGVNINSQTLGHSNIAQIPNFLFDDVKIQYGSSSSLYGTDAIGGSIHLDNKTNWNQGLNIGLESSIASFSSYFKGINLGYSNRNISYKVKTYHLGNKNNFPFINTAVKDFEKNEFVNDTSKNSALVNYGILNELDFKLSNKLFYFVKYWYDHNWYEAQPNMSSNYYDDDFVEILNKHHRIITGLKYYRCNERIKLQLGYISDYQLYNKNLEQIISTETLVGKIDYYNTSLGNGLLNAGINYNFIIPDVYAYKKGISEKRINIFTSYKKMILPKLSAILNLRETIVINYKNRFTPSFGIDYNHIDDKDKKLKYKLSYSSSYKIPTFNQRFWYPNGNPNILPEKGDNFEFNTEYFKKHNNVEYSLALSMYYMSVDNWIQWVNKGIWQPVNVKKVINKGTEIQFKTKFNSWGFNVKTGINYSYTNAKETKSYIGGKLSNKQLIYTPKHLGKIYINLRYNTWSILLNSSYTGKRYTENYKQLDGYLLLNMRIGKNVKMGSHLFNINFKANNIFNKSYQNWDNYAMPGRNYTINLKYFYKQLK